MKKRLALIALLHIIIFAKGQFYYPLRQDAADFSKRTLLVQILEEEPAVIKKLEKHHSLKAEHEKALAEYRELIKLHNEWIKQAVVKYWKVNEKVDFKTKKETDEILHDIKVLRKYAVLNTGWRNEYRYKGDEAEVVEAYGLVAYVAEATDRHLSDLRRGRDKKTDYIFKVLFPTDALELSDFVFAVQQFNYHLNNASVEGPVLERYRTLPFLPPFNKAGYEVIQQKTLLIPQACIPAEKEEELRLVYEYPIQLVTNKFYEEAITHQFARHAYVTLAWSDRQHNFTYFVVNAAEGIILAQLGPKSPDLHFVHHTLGRKSTDEVYTDYKEKMGFSMTNILQLKHLLPSSK